MSNIFYNTGDKPIFITFDYKVDPNGGPALPTMQTCIGPGQAIDLDITSLKREEDMSFSEKRYHLASFQQGE